jgi:hypothetical protein
MGMRSVRPAVLATALVLTLAGCAGKDRPVKVSGRVTLDGKPVAGAAVLFLREGGNGPPAHAETDEAGGFTLTTFSTGDGALPGDYRVTVAWEELPPPAFRTTGDPSPSREELKKKVAEEQEKRRRLARPAAIPAVYGDPSKTPLTQQVPPSGKVNLELSSGAR